MFLRLAKMLSENICLIQKKNTYSIKKHYTAILHQDNAFSDLFICLCKSEFHARTIFRYSKYPIILLKAKPLFIDHSFEMIYLSIYLYIYTNLPVNPIVRLPHPRSSDSQGQETILAHYIFIYLSIYLYIYIYIYVYVKAISY